MAIGTPITSDASMPEFESAKALGQFLTSSRLVTNDQLLEVEADLRNLNDTEELLLGLERKGYLTSLQTDKLRKGDRHGYFIGRFRVLYKIDSGTFARVYRADEPGTGRVVAIKLLRNRHTENPETIELFEREGRMGMTLRHPNVVELISVGREPDSNLYYIVMEFVEGGNLRDILNIRKRFGIADGLKMIEDIAAALAYAYSRGLTHRDLKLSNVLVSSSGTAKVVDFGLAQIFMNKFFAEDDKQVARTVDYAGLEKATNAPLNDVRSDIYFLGCVAYEILSGRPPLPPTKNKIERMQRERFLRVKPLEPGDLESPFPQVVRLVNTMMSVDPTQRFQTPAQLYDAIKRVRAETVGVAGKDGSIRKAGATIFLVENDERLQDAMRDKLKQMGYRVLISGDPTRAVERFQQHPFQLLLVDVGTTQKDGQAALRNVLMRARSQSLQCQAIAIISAEDPDLQLDPELRKNVAVLRRPLNLGQLVTKIKQLVPTEA